MSLNGLFQSGSISSGGSDDSEQNPSEKEQELKDVVAPDTHSYHSNEISDACAIDNITENPTGVMRQIQEITSTSSTPKENEGLKSSIYCHCEPNDPKDIKWEAVDDSKRNSYKKCSECGKTKYVDPWWIINDAEDVTGIREQILRFIKYHNPTKSFLCQTADHKFKPFKEDRFGIVRSVKCDKCEVEMSLKMNTASNRHKLSVVENADDLKPGDEIAFRRWYGISHHAIFRQKKELEEIDDGCCGSCRKYCRISDDTIEVVSHTLDGKVARIIKSDEWLQGGVDVYRVEYEHSYPPEWTEMIVMRAAQFAEYNKLSDEKHSSNYNPFLNNCEHFARRCKTGQNESVQVQDSLKNSCLHVAILVLRIAIVATWWIAEATINDNEIMETTTVSELRSDQNSRYSLTGKDLERMEVTLATSICALFLTLKVIFSSIYECRKLRRRHRFLLDEETSAIGSGRCANCCSRCFCRCCPFHGFRYFCRIIFCLVPIRLCRQISTGYCKGPVLWFCCSQYVVIVLRVLISEVIVIGVPIAFFATFEWYCSSERFTENSVIRAAYGFLFSFPFVLILSALHSCISNALGRCIGWCCRRCCCCGPKSNNVPYSSVPDESDEHEP